MDEIFGGPPANDPASPAARSSFDDKLSGTKTPVAAAPKPSAAESPALRDATADQDSLDAAIAAADAQLEPEAPLAPVLAPEVDFPAATDVEPPSESKTTSLVPPPLAKARRIGPSYRLLRFALGFAVAGLAVVLLMVGIASALRAEYSDRVAPGVRVGTVDVSGLTRGEAITKLTNAYAYLGQGQVTVATASGATTIAYDKAGRGPDVETMVDQSMRVGHTGDPIADTVALLKSAINGETVPISVSLDAKAVATQVRQLVATNTKPKDATAAITGEGFTLNHAVDGKGIDEVAISAAIVDHLGVPGQGSSFQAGGAFITLKPTVSDADAQRAIADAQRMFIDVQLTYTPPTTATATPGSAASAKAGVSAGASASASPSGTKNYTISKDVVLSWINFGFNSGGHYVASVDVARIQSAVSAMKMDVTSVPVEPTVTFDAAGKPVGVTGGIPGTGLNTGATADSIANYLDSLASGGPKGDVTVVTTAVDPSITPDTLKGMLIVGAWTTQFYPDISNGMGANIRQPARVFNGQIVAAGAQFDFLQRVGPIDPAHGFALGGVIVHGKSDHTGAMGGGICSASTTMFNAAIWAGLQVDERHNHAYYINRYPIGLDATVFSNGWQTYDMKWTNDTPNPIVIRAWTTKGSKSTITVQLWSLPSGRKTTFTPAVQANLSRATDSKVYTTKIAPGATARAEYPTDGFDTVRTRTVTDSTGQVIHSDTWKSHYLTVNGELWIGVAPGGASTPAPSGLVLLPLLGWLPKRWSNRTDGKRAA